MRYILMEYELAQAKAWAKDARGNEAERVKMWGNGFNSESSPRMRAMRKPVESPCSE
jgi:hypothetical protein